MADMSITRSALEPFISSANEAIKFKIVKDPSELNDDKTSFHPEFTHQIFGDNESIFGYRDLNVHLYYSAARLTTYLNMTYKEKVDPDICEGVQPDEIVGVIAAKLQPGFLTNLQDFTASLAKDKSFVPYGQLLHSFKNKSRNDNTQRTYEVFVTTVQDPGFREYHERLQTFVLWYIDAASFIDVDDDKWTFFILYEKYRTSSGDSMYAIVGYTTVYEYYAYPQNLRPRISQMLILRPNQKAGLGAEMLQTIYNYYGSKNDVIDLTVEDPSDNFVRLRDFVDAKNCCQLKSFSEQNLPCGFSDEMVKEARDKLKLNKKQTRRIYEILRLHVTDLSDAQQYRQYRLDVKKRLNLPFQKERLDMMKLQESLPAEELQATMSFKTREQRLDQLDVQYKDLEADYRHILERIAAFTSSKC